MQQNENTHATPIFNSKQLSYQNLYVKECIYNYKQCMNNYTNAQCT